MAAKRAVFSLAAVVLVLFPPVAHASVPIESFSALPSSTQAGGHPDFVVNFSFGNRTHQPDPCGCHDMKDSLIRLPAGLIGNPHATPQCSPGAFALGECPVDSQLGVTVVNLYSQGESSAGFMAPLFNLVPPPGDAGLLGFKSGLLENPNFEVISARTDSDYGLNVEVANITHILPLYSIKQVVWGVPAASAHDRLRFAFAQEPAVSIASFAAYLCDSSGRLESPEAMELCPAFRRPAIGPEGPIASDSPQIPFTQNPTTCGESSLASELRLTAYDRGVTEATASWPPTTGCDQLSFNPSLFALPTTAEADSPSGIDIDLRAPMFESPEAPSPSEIRATVATLPEGFTINPAAAAGKSACSDAEARFGTTEEARCPEYAKVGTLAVHSPVFPGVLPGALYIGQPLPGNRYRLFLVFDGFGLHVKLPGTVHPDPNTGRLVTEFRNLPQFPFEDFDLHFFGSERGILATPTRCGTYPITTEFEPWDAALPNKISTQYFTIESGPNGGPCPSGPRPFSPAFEAAAQNNTGGAHTSFALDLKRQDGEQNLSGLTVATPPGFSATLAGVPYCPQAAIEAASAPGYSGLLEQEHPSCPASSLVGESFAGSGVGTHPFYASGKVYLAGPYKGAPLSLLDITPAVSGPYDLGDVVIRVALRVNPETTQVTAVSDPLPGILEGIPLRIREILLELNRPGFALNPTNCEPLSVQATILGSEGASTTPSVPFQVANCARLRFAPKLTLSLKGPTKRAQNPVLKAVLTMKPGEANVARAQVNLPGSEFLDNAHIGTVCTKVQFAEGAKLGEKCPPASVYGFARAVTPLLDHPLEGPVYLRSPLPGHKLPDLVAALGGQISVALVGKVDTGPNKGIRNTFEVVPDAPVTQFTLEMQGGAKGLLENSEDICSHAQRAIADFTAQNGKVDDFHSPIANSCKKKKKGKRAHLARARRANRGGAR